MFVLMCFLYIHITGLVWPAILAAVGDDFVGFFFATFQQSGRIHRIVNNPFQD